MDNQQFDRIARALGSRRSRRQALTAMAGAAAGALVVRTNPASAGAEVCALTCPSDPFVGTEPGTCSALVKLGSPTPNDFCGETPEITCDAPGDSSFEFGDTVVTCSVAESDATCNYTVHIYDTNPATLTCPADISMEAEEPTAVNFDDPVASTICEELDFLGANCDHASGDVFPLGTTLVTCELVQPVGKGPDPVTCAFNITLAPAPPTATPTDVPPTTAPTTVPGDPTATEVPATIAPTSVPGDPTATTAPVTELPNTGSGDGGSGTVTRLLPVAIGGAGAALLVRLGLRQRPAEAKVPVDQ